MKRIFLFLTCLVLMNLACLQSAAISDQQLAASFPTSEITTATAAPAAQPTLTKVPTAAATSAHKPCANVIAFESLHLRSDPNENATVLTWLKHGDQVQVISIANADWWLVRFGSLTGFARSVYLQESECGQ